MYKIACLLAVVFLFTAFKKKESTWMAIGDSITYLNEHAGETDKRVTAGYMTRVVKELPRIKYINQGHNGWTAGNFGDKINDLGFVRADIYSIFLGTNDWWQGRPVGAISDYNDNTGNKTFYGSMRIIIDKIHELNGAAKIILITPMQRSDFVYLFDPNNNAYGSYKEKDGQSLEGFAKAVIAIGKKEGYAVVDLYHKKELSLPHLVKFKRLRDVRTGDYKNVPYPAYIGVPFNPLTDDYPYSRDAIDITYDGLHPSDKGYQVIANMLVKKMKRY